MTWYHWLLLLGAIMTVVNLAIYFMFGPEPLAMALVWILTRIPGHAGARCPVYFLDPVGPWPGVCERACRNGVGDFGITMVKACYVMSGRRREYGDV
jgi:hypothetical protein